jgi:hypothetical protein
MRLTHFACGKEFADSHTGEFSLYIASNENTRTAGRTAGSRHLAAGSDD